MRKNLQSYLLFFFAGLILLAVPLLRDLHFESAMLAGVIGCVWAGLKAADKKSVRDFFPTVNILLHLFCMGIPLFIYALFTGCLTFDGFGFWLLIPVPSTFFGAAIGRLTRKFRLQRSRFWTLFILILIAFGLLLLEFLWLPQVYFYNHVWGLWPGPIFDESVKLGGAFIYFRWLTFLWIILLWILPEWDTSLQSKLITGLAFFSLLFSYMNLDSAGIISPGEYLQAQLGGSYSTDHFDIYYDMDLYTKEEVKYWAAKHEFYFQQVTNVLKVQWPEGRKIESYLYAHAWQKKKLTGAKFTSYVPIWLERDQLHIARQQLEPVLKHELVHVISKQFGNRLFHGSWSIGMIEGIAEAVANDASSRSTLHQLVASQDPLPSADDMRASFSFWGFYKNAGAISYTTTGSFVKYLLDTYPVQDLKEAYGNTDIQSAYQVPFDTLIAGWHSQLRKTPLDSVDREVSEYLFSQLSLFQKPCPHSVSKKWMLWDAYQFHLADQDTQAAYNSLNDLYALDNKSTLVADEWLRAQILQGRYKVAASSVPDTSQVIPLQVLRADALFLDGKESQARQLLSDLAPEINASSEPMFTHTLDLRADSMQWSYHTGRRYLKFFPDSISFTELNTPNKMLTLQKANRDKRFELLRLYTSLLLKTENENRMAPEWFSIYESSIDHLAYSGEFALAQNVIAMIQAQPLRRQFQERVKQQIQWLQFMRVYKSVAD